jgi:hypothetical protein
VGSVTELPPLNRRFTYAYSDTNHVSGRRHRSPSVHGEQHLYFVFSDEDLTDDLEEALLRDPAFDFFFPEIRYGAYIYDCFSITDDPGLLYTNIDRGENIEIASVIRGEYRLLQLRDIRDACPLPHKYVLGCKTCMDEETEYNVDYCEARRLREQRLKTLPQEHIDEVYNWKNLKKKIGDFVFVSPSTVQEKVFTSRIVAPRDIDFSQPERHLERRQEGMVTRGKRRDFRKEHCSKCLVSGVCYQGTWCDRRFDKTENEYYTDILERTNIPFTDKQIRILLYNSGELSKRYGRRQSYLSFRYVNGSLEFVVGDIHHGNERALTYREALKILEEQGSLLEPPKFKITKKLKALLATTTTITENRGPKTGWGHHHYPVRYTTYSSGQERFTQYYYRYHRMKEGVNVEDLQDIYREEYKLPFIPGTFIPRTDRT